VGISGEIVPSPALFQTLALNQLIAHWASQRQLTSEWVEIAVVMQLLNKWLVSWFDKQAYDP